MNWNVAEMKDIFVDNIKNEKINTPPLTTKSDLPQLHQNGKKQNSGSIDFKRNYSDIEMISSIVLGLEGNELKTDTKILQNDRK